LSGELETVHKKLEEVLSKRGEIEAERRKYEQRIAILQTELENNQRISTRLEKVLAENDNLKKQAKELVTQNGDLQQLSDRQASRISELHKQSQDESLASRQYHNKVVTEIEKQIIEERERGQKMIDDTRKALKAKIQVMEASIQDFTKSGLDAGRDMRKLERNLKAAQRQFEEQQASLAFDARRIESLERKLKQQREKAEKVAVKRSELETRNYGVKRDIDSLGAQLEAALYINTKLNSEVPLESKSYIQDPLASPSEKTEKSKSVAFDTSVDDVVVDDKLKGLGQ